MPNSLPSADPSPTSDARAEPADADGWRKGGLAGLRAELDRIDDSIHDLLMRRALVVEEVARSGKPAALRPGREASIIRRLIARHRGALPAGTLVRLWRELLAGTTSMQGNFSLAVCDSDPGAPLTQMAREHFGALTPLRMYHSPGQALMDVSQGSVAVAVLPYPSDTDTWWASLLHHDPRLHIIARLPFWQPRSEGAPQGKAVVVAATAADASGDDWSFLGLECDSDASRTRLSSELSAAGLKPETMVLIRSPGSPAATVLIEVPGFISDDDARLGRLGAVLRHPVVLGTYAAPISGGAQ